VLKPKYWGREKGRGGEKRRLQSKWEKEKTVFLNEVGKKEDLFLFQPRGSQGKGGKKEKSTRSRGERRKESSLFSINGRVGGGKE